MTSHVLNVSCNTCTCGKWQEYDIPCLDAMAYFRLFLEKDFEWVLRNKVSKYFTYGAEKDVLQKNIVPVVIDSLTYDGKTKPPEAGQKRKRGRPKSKRLRKRSRFANPEKESPQTCSICGQRGHYWKTCERRKKQKEGGEVEKDVS